MKYILLKGKMNAGKSETITSVCKNFDVNSCQRISLNAEGELIIKNDSSENFGNGTFIINVNGSNILIVAGAPTEQKITITIMLKVLAQIQVEIVFAIISVRSREVLAGFDTANELNKLGHECVLEEEVIRIDSDDYSVTTNWRDRVKRIVELINQNVVKKLEIV